MSELTDTEVTTLTDACHSLLLRLAGRIPDGLLTQSRAWLAALEPERMAGAVASHAAAARLALAAEDAGLLGWILTGAGMDVAAAARVPVWTGPGTDPADGMVGHVFAPASPEVMAARGGEFGPCLDLTVSDAADSAPASLSSDLNASLADDHARAGTESAGLPGDPNASLADDHDRAGTESAGVAAGLSSGLDASLADDLDRSAIAAAAQLPGAAALWRTWRAPSDGAPWPPPRRVFLLALTPQAEPFEAAAALQEALAALGEPDPQVEAFAADEHLPAYQRSARARSALLWAADRPAPIHLAPVYDGVLPDGTPMFDLGRPRLSPADREPVVAALDAGSVLMSTTARLDDVLDPVDGRGQVPSGFRTDGSWVWSDAVAYYLRTHGVAPVAALLAHLTTSPSAATSAPDAVALFRATAALTRPPRPSDRSQ